MSDFFIEKNKKEKEKEKKSTFDKMYFLSYFIPNSIL